MLHLLGCLHILIMTFIAVIGFTEPCSERWLFPCHVQMRDIPKRKRSEVSNPFPALFGYKGGY